MKLSALQAHKLRELLAIVIYWVITIRFVIVLESFSISDFTTYDPKVFQVLRDNFLAGFVAGIAIGLLTGLSELYLFQRYFRNQPFYRLLITKSIVYFLSITIISFLTYAGYSFKYHTQNLSESLQISLLIFSSGAFYHLMLLGAMLSLGLNFMLITKNKIGYSIFLPILMGKYHRPKEEDRIFLFIDLKASTTIAEKLGHEKYSNLIQDCFNDLANLVIKYHGSIYQFVGDEAVITWKAKKQYNYLHAVELFFQYQNMLYERSEFYLKKYDVIPLFKGSANAGKVMVAEVGGSIKSEIAYHGDVLNAAARMMELCKVYQKDLILSEHIFNQIPKNISGIEISYHGEFQLRGKDNSIKAYGAVENKKQRELI